MIGNVGNQKVTMKNANESHILFCRSRVCVSASATHKNRGRARTLWVGTNYHACSYRPLRTPDRWNHLKKNDICGPDISKRNSSRWKIDYCTRNLKWLTVNYFHMSCCIWGYRLHLTHYHYIRGIKFILV